VSGVVSWRDLQNESDKEEEDEPKGQHLQVIDESQKQLTPRAMCASERRRKHHRGMSDSEASRSPDPEKQRPQ
jgi:hypothetical protein